ncbi:MAG TPA: hypothetical protein VF139_06645, partial [Candidatus Polarisedimenticolaceae bacterium]
DSDGSEIFDDAGRVVIVGVPGIVVARSGNDVLVVARNRSEGVREAVATIRGQGKAAGRASQPRRSRSSSSNSRS